MHVGMRHASLLWGLKCHALFHLNNMFVFIEGWYFKAYNLHG